MEQRNRLKKEHSGWGVSEEEEMEEATLEGRKSSQSFKDNKMNTSVAAATSSFPPEMNCIISEHKHHCTDEEEKDAATSVDAINIASFDDQEDIQNTRFNVVNNACKKTVADKDPLDDFDQKLRELDVEAVLAKQETHDLFCPNCKSCITKRVILRKRKRRVQDLDPTAKRDKFDTVVSSKMVDGSACEANRSDEAVTSNINREVPPADIYGLEREPEVFRCLSCFRYFIPSRNSFNLFHKFAGTRQQERLQDCSSVPAFESQDSSRIPMTDEKNLSNIPASNSNWFFSLFSSKKWRTSSDMIHVKDLSASTISSEAAVKAEEHARDPAPKPYVEETEISEKDIYKKSSIATEDKLNLQNSHHPSSLQGSQVPSQSFCSAELAKIATSNIQTIGGDNEYLPEQDLTQVEEIKKEIEEERNPLIGTEKKGGEVMVLVEPVESTTIQTEDSVPIEGTILIKTSTQAQVQNGEQAGGEVGEPFGWELLKSIVYGGLVESISSLGIVTSAASAGSSSLNIIALGLANLVGGLFIIVHHLMELKEEEEDKYQRLLGRPENFVLHAILAILSGLIFGAVPIVIYSILIGENYSSKVKVTEVVAASLVCIILLVIVKVYTKRPPKSYLKTMSYYLTLVVATSGVSYGVGQLIKDLIVKLSKLESGFAIPMPISVSVEREALWTPY